MGDWYVLAHIPAPAEKDAWNGVEVLPARRRDEGRRRDHFSFRPGSFEAPLEVMRPTGYVSEDDAAVWA